MGEEPQATKLWIGGQEAFPKMLKAIDMAQKSIRLEMYIFRKDKTGQQFINALTQARQRGVNIDVTLDAVGSFNDLGPIVLELRNAEIKTHIFNPTLNILVGRLRRNHRKILVIDETIAFVGGLNFGDEYAAAESKTSMHDFMLEIRGDVARWLHRKLAGKHPKRPQKANTQINLSWWGGGRRLAHRYLKTIREAQHCILVAHAYFFPEPSLLRALQKKARRGLKVVLLLPGVSDIPWMQALARSIYTPLRRSGIEIYEWSEAILHAKLMIVDDKQLLIGSFNLDPLSLFNFEVLAETIDQISVERAVTWFSMEQQRSEKISDQIIKRKGSAITQLWVMFLAQLARFVLRVRGWKFLN